MTSNTENKKRQFEPVVRFMFLLLVQLALIFPVGAQSNQIYLIDSLKNEVAKAKVKGSEDSNTVKSLLKIALTLANNFPDEGMTYANEGLSLSKRLDWAIGVGRSHNILGICYTNKSDNENAIKHLSEALALFEREHYKKGILQAIGNLGVVYEAQSDYGKALENNMLAFKYAEETNDTLSQLINLVNIGSNYQYLSNFGQALKYDELGLKYATQLHDTFNMATIIGNMGNVYTSLKDFDKALPVHLQALKLHLDMGNDEGIEREMNNIGQLYMYSEKYDSALFYLIRSNESSNKSGIIFNATKSLSLIGETLIGVVRDSTNRFMGHGLVANVVHGRGRDKQSILRSAIEYLSKSIAINIDIESLDELVYNYQSLAAAQELLGDYKAANNSHVLMAQIKDSIVAKESAIRIKNLENKQELALKDKQIEIDKLEVEKKRNVQAGLIVAIVLLVLAGLVGIRNIRLKAAKELSENRLNAFRARMNPHFIFNSLNTIQSLVLKNETIPSIRYLSEFSKLMRQILDNSAKSRVRLSEELQMLQSYMTLEQLRYNNFTWEIHIDDGVSAELVYIPGMIIQPFVENSIVHGFHPEIKDGMLRVSFARTEKQIICVVDDNGIGRARSAELNKERSKERQSHGIHIATSRLTLLNNKKKRIINKVEYTDKAEHGRATGTKVTILIPIL